MNMSSRNVTDRLDALVQIARATGAAILTARGRALDAWVKPGNELVTRADRDAHEVLINALIQYFPGLPCVTEESPAHRIPDGPFLVADELDGTVPFAAGSADWGVLLALVDQVPRLGVIHLPDRGVLITAARGGGCQLNGRPVALQSNPDESGMVLGLEINAGLQDGDWAVLRRAAGLARAVRATACTAASVHELLKGITQAYINPRGGRIWDFAAPALAIAEAGGCMSNCAGGPLRWDEIHMNFLAARSPQLLRSLTQASGLP
jgi:fructose-1,6-bisphosphatase/inositol monophosphatase family enzyme